MVIKVDKGHEFMKSGKKIISEYPRLYTEKEYWEGLVPDELFEEYLNKYGYEYTPPVDRNEITKLATPLQEGEETKT